MPDDPKKAPAPDSTLNDPDATLAKKNMLRKLAESYMTDPGSAVPFPAELGVVVGSKGGQALVDQLLGENITSPKQAAIRYMELKYPKLMSKITGGILIQNAPKSSVRGQISYAFPKVTTNAFTPTMTLNLGHPLMQDPVMQMAGTIGHELTHGAIQNYRTPEMVSRGVYQSAPIARNKLNFNDPDYLAYWNQPAEVNARQGGQTSVDTLLNFLKTYPGLNKLFGKE